MTYVSLNVCSCCSTSRPSMLGIIMFSSIRFGGFLCRMVSAVFLLVVLVIVKLSDFR